MADNTVDFDGMIDTLEQKIAAMQEAVISLKRARDVLSGMTVTGGRSGEFGVDEFTGMNITDAAEKFLRLVGRPARSTQEIVEGLNKGGLERVSPESVATLLIRSHNGDGKVVRVQKGMWGLAEWYPKRPQKLKRSKNGNDSEEETSEIEEETKSDSATE